MGTGGANMRTVIKQYMSTKRGGFNGVTHLIIGVFIFSVVFLINTFPLPHIETYSNHVTGEFVTAIISFFIITGGSLFPDLDSKRSTAMFRLGTTGRFLNMFMIGTGNALWKLYHLKRDRRPGMYHRVIYHTPAFVVIMATVFMMAPKSNDAMWGSFIETRVKDLPVYMLENGPTFLIVISAYLMIKLSVGTILYKPFKKLFRRQFASDATASIIAVFFTYTIMSMSYTSIRMIGITVVIGYSSHLIGDLFTRGSIPLLWPIPIKGEAYRRPNFFFQISSDEGPAGIVNRVVIVGTIFIIVMIFIRLL